jgi:hypothetical protein
MFLSWLLHLKNRMHILYSGVATLLSAALLFLPALLLLSLLRLSFAPPPPPVLAIPPPLKGRDGGLEGGE